MRAFVRSFLIPVFLYLIYQNSHRLREYQRFLLSFVKNVRNDLIQFSRQIHQNGDKVSFMTKSGKREYSLINNKEVASEYFSQVTPSTISDHELNKTAYDTSIFIALNEIKNWHRGKVYIVPVMKEIVLEILLELFFPKNVPRNDSEMIQCLNSLERHGNLFSVFETPIETEALLKMEKICAKAKEAYKFIDDRKGFARMFCETFEVTRSIICWTLINLSKHEQVQEDLSKEILHLLGKRVPPSFGEVDAESLPLLEAVIKESVRTSPPIPIYQTKSTGLGKIPRDAIINFPIFLNNQSTSFFPQHPENFIPGRHLKEGEQTILIEKNLISDLSWNISKAIITIVLQNYTLQSPMDEKSNDGYVLEAGVYQPIPDFYMTFQKSDVGSTL